MKRPSFYSLLVFKACGIWKNDSRKTSAHFIGQHQNWQCCGVADSTWHDSASGDRWTQSAVLWQGGVHGW